MTEDDLKRIERESRELLEKLQPHLASVEIWVIAAAISRMMDIEPRLVPLLEGAVLSARAETARVADVERLIAPPPKPSLMLVKP